MTRGFDHRRLLRCVCAAMMLVGFMLPEGRWFDHVATCLTLAALLTLLVDYAHRH